VCAVAGLTPPGIRSAMLPGDRSVQDPLLMDRASCTHAYLTVMGKQSRLSIKPGQCSCVKASHVIAGHLAGAGRQASTSRLRAHDDNTDVTLSAAVHSVGLLPLLCLGGTIRGTAVFVPVRTGAWIRHSAISPYRGWRMRHNWRFLNRHQFPRMTRRHFALCACDSVGQKVLLLVEIDCCNNTLRFPFLATQASLFYR